MSLHIHTDPVLPRLLQQVAVAAGEIRGDLFEPRGSTAPNQQTWPGNPLAGGDADLLRPQGAVILPAAALGAAGSGSFAWLGSWRLRWSDLVQRSDWAEHAVFVVPVARHDNRLLAPFNATADSLAGRWSRPELLARRGWQAMLTLFVPHRAAAPADCVIAVNAHPDLLPQVTAAPALPVQLGGVAAAVAATLPQITLLAPATLAAGATAEIPLQLHSHGQLLAAPATVHAEASAGYLPLGRVAVCGGEAVLRLTALGLAPGDAVHLKAGWKFWPGAAEADIAIV